MKKIRSIVLALTLTLLVTPTQADYIFGEPTNLGPKVNTSSVEGGGGGLCISSDSLSLYFDSNRSGGYGKYDIWVAKRASSLDPWGEPMNLGPTINSAATEGGPYISADDLALYFSAERPGGLGGYDIWVATRETREESWNEPVNLGSPVNSSLNDHMSCISADGLSLFLSSDSANRPNGVGERDLWVTKRGSTDADWETPVNLGPSINSPSNERRMCISSDGLAIFFQSDRPGGYGYVDIWASTRATRNDGWSMPVNVGPLVNSWTSDVSPSLSSDGHTLYLGADSLAGGFGSWDLWQAPILPVVDFDGNRNVGMTDLLTLIDYWGTNEPLCDVGPMPWGDGVVDAADLEVLMGQWGPSGPFDIVVDDFESYTDEEPMLIWSVWWDGWGDPANGSAVGNGDEPEKGTVYRGGQAMPLHYDNSTALISETTRAWGGAQDWTRGGGVVLTLWIYGDPGNAAEPLYVALEDRTGVRAEVIHPDPTPTTAGGWQEWRVDLTDFTGVDLTAINSMSIGVGDPTRSTPGGSGFLIVDDIKIRTSPEQD